MTLTRLSGGLELRFEILPGEPALFDDIGGDSPVHPLADLAADIEGAGRARNLDRSRIAGDGRWGVRGVEIAALHGTNLLSPVLGANEGLVRCDGARGRDHDAVYLRRRDRSKSTIA